MPGRAALTLAVAAILTAYGGALDARLRQAASAPAPSSAGPVRAVLDQYCVTCHNDKLNAAGLRLDRIDPARIGGDAEVWEKVVAKLRAGMMPPIGASRPPAEITTALADALERNLDASGAAHPFAGPATIRRLTRGEYAAMVEDLLGVRIDAHALLPVDETSFGFDNNADALALTPALLQRYLSAAAKVARQVGPDNPDTARVFICTPRSNADDRCAENILFRLARLAYRRPVKLPDVAPLLRQFGEGRADSFDEGVRRAVQLLLVDPEFLYRSEQTPGTARPGALFRLADVDLASRLSFLIWSSGPDDELLDVAQQDRLHDPMVLERQVRRMLRDDRARRFVSDFAGQWLGVRAIDEQRPDEEAFRGFSKDVRAAMVHELDLFLDNEFRSDASIVNLLHADYTFLNGPLARYYGIAGVDGSDFQRVALQDPARYGVLGKGAVLLMTSYANRTSPVARGKWILGTLLGAPVPAPPPVVPPLPDADTAGLQTVRERLEQHRRNAVCATCHAVMDPLGLALENFDATGRWRDREDGAPIDARGALVDGTVVSGPSQLHDALVGRSDQFVRAFAGKLFTYALGRGLDYRDQPAVREAVRSASTREYRWSAMVTAVVASREFQMARRPDVIDDGRPGGTR